MTVAWHRFQGRIERACAATGNSYPWWLALWTTVATVAIAIAAFVQRGTPDVASAIALVLTLVPVVWWTVTARLLPMPVEATTLTAAVVLFLLEPVNPDLAPFLLMLRVAEVAATVAWPAAAAVGLVGTGVFAGAAVFGHLDNVTIYVIGLVLGFDVGLTLRWYMRALAAERERTEIARREARSDERRRVAREVHDVVGHSLSITLLHVTAARHSLQQHADIADAVDSLAEAERVGRAAMADVRRSVTVLGTAGAEPAPGVADIADLVAGSRSAGLDVRYEHDGSLAATDVAGLELYRIVQESLANVAKHAPASSVCVRLVSAGGGLRLSVRNTLGGAAPHSIGAGLGLPGMADRARQMGGRLHAGVDGDEWSVDVLVPADG